MRIEWQQVIPSWDVARLSAYDRDKAKNNVEHWEVEIELERIAMQANCVRDNHNNSIMVIGIKRVQLNDLNIPITHARMKKNQDQTVLIDQKKY